MQTINSSEALSVTAHTVLTVWSLCREHGANPREGPCVCRARCCGLVPSRCCPRGWGIWLSEAAGLHLFQHSVVWTGGHTALRYSGVPLRTSGASQSQKRGAFLPEDLQVRRTASFCWEQSDERCIPCHVASTQIFYPEILPILEINLCM